MMPPMTRSRARSMDKPAITVSIKSVYGVQTIYPVCERGQLFAQLAGTKTLTPRALELIEQLGFDVHVEAPTLKIGNRVVGS